jgi:hypothetical protein
VEKTHLVVISNEVWNLSWIETHEGRDSSARSMARFAVNGMTTFLVIPQTVQAEVAGKVQN